MSDTSAVPWKSAERQMKLATPKRVLGQYLSDHCVAKLPKIRLASLFDYIVVCNHTLRPSDDSDFDLTSSSDVMNSICNVFRIEMCYTVHSARNIEPDRISKCGGIEELSEVVLECFTTISSCSRNLNLCQCENFRY